MSYIDPSMGMGMGAAGMGMGAAGMGAAGMGAAGMDMGLGGNSMYRLSTQTNILMIGYILLMILNHLNLVQTLFGSTSKFTGQLRIWLFAAILILTVVNCLLMIILKERRRPFMSFRRDMNGMPIAFTVIQVLILGLTTWLYLISEPSDSFSKKMNTVGIYFFINISSMLSTWGFALSRCSLDALSASGMGMSPGMGMGMSPGMGMGMSPGMGYNY